MYQTIAMYRCYLDPDLEKKTKKQHSWVREMWTFTRYLMIVKNHEFCYEKNGIILLGFWYIFIDTYYLEKYILFTDIVMDEMTRSFRVALE